MCAAAFIAILNASLFVEISKPHPSALQYQLAQAYYQKGRFKEAKASLITVAEDFEPGRKQLLMANIALQTGDLPSAINLYELLLRQNPLSFESNYNLSLALLISGSTETLEQRLLSLQKYAPALAFCISSDILNSEFADRVGNLQRLQRAFDTTYDCSNIR